MTGGACEKAERRSSGALAPFDEELVLGLRGPLDVRRAGVWHPGGAGRWPRGAAFAAGGEWSNLTLLRNAPWAQRLEYATGDGEAASPAPAPLAGALRDGVAVSMWSGAPHGAAAVPGSAAAAGRAYAGFAGRKVIALEVRMPEGAAAPDLAGSGARTYSDEPAVYLKSARIMRENEYGCNCDRRGCGELDVWEVVGSVSRATAQPHIYSWQTGLVDQPTVYFPRPTHDWAVVAVVLDIAGGEGVVQVAHLAGFDFPDELRDDDLAGWRASSRPGDSCWDLAAKRRC